jgi:hypothetical protein
MSVVANMFYKMVDDTTHPTGWWLDEIRAASLAFDERILTWGRHVDDPGPLTIALKRDGEPVNLGFTLLQVPVATSQVADMIDRIAPGAIERFPVRVAGSTDSYEAVNVVRVLDVIDRDRSEYLLWKPEDGRPDDLGTFRGVYRLVVKDDVRQSAGIFRPAGWTVALIVSAVLKKELEKLGGLAVRFRPLEGGFNAN